MLRRLSKLASSSTCFLVAARLAAAQAAPGGGVAGIVVDRQAAPVAGVTIRMGDNGSTSGADGRFRLDGLPPGTRYVVARRLGYAPETVAVTVKAGAVDSIRFVLHDVPATIDGVETIDRTAIPARLEGFERRRARRNGGQFVTRADMERTMPQSTAEVLRRLQGVRIVDSMGVLLPVSTRGPKPTLTDRRPMGPCVMRVGVDGVIKEPGFAMNSISVRDIHGIELYSGPSSLPSEFSGGRRDAGCGLLMIWTRSR